MPLAKTDVAWIDADTLFVGTDFGPGSMTDSGYPRIVRRWKRGTPLAQATTVFEGERGDVSAGAWLVRTPGHERTLFVRSLDFYHRRTVLLEGGKLVPLDVPSDARTHFMRDTLLITLSAGESHTFHVTGASAPTEVGVPVLRSVNDLLTGE